MVNEIDCKWERRYRELERTLEAVLNRGAGYTDLVAADGTPAAIERVDTVWFGEKKMIYCSATGVDLIYSFLFKDSGGKIIESVGFTPLNCFPLISPFLAAAESVEVIVRSNSEGDSSSEDRKTLKLWNQ